MHRELAKLLEMLSSSFLLLLQTLFVTIVTCHDQRQCDEAQEALLSRKTCNDAFMQFLASSESSTASTDRTENQAELCAFCEPSCLDLINSVFISCDDEAA